MSTFFYKAIDASGSEESGTLDAQDEGIAFELLNARGLTVFELADSSCTAADELPWYRRDIRFRSGQLALSQQASFAKLLASLVEARLPFSEVLRIAETAISDARLKSFVQRVRQRVIDGQDIGSAIEAENTILSPLFSSFMQTGSATSDIGPVLHRLAAQLENQNALRNKVSSALIYPTILLLAAVALFFVVTFYLVPNLAPIFEAVGKPPPPTIGWLLGFRAFIVDSWPLLIFLTLAGILAVISLSLSKHKSVLSALLDRLPIVGELRRLNTLSELSGAVGILLQAGLPLTEALRKSSATIPTKNRFSVRFREAADNIEAGLSASSAIKEDDAFPPEYQQLFNIGEETNQLRSTMETLTGLLSHTLEEKTQRALALLTPAVTIVMGLGIGLMIYTLMGAILEVNEIAF